MSAESFMEAAREDAAVSAWIAEAAKTANDGDESASRNTHYDLTLTATSPLWFAAAYVVYRLLKIGLDWIHNKAELSTTKEYITLIDTLVKDGYSKEEAQKLVAALLADISQRSADDPALARVKELAGRA